MTCNRVFFPQAGLDHWLSEGKLELSSDALTLVGEGRRYRIAEAARVLREVTGTPDPYDIVGRVKSRAALMELGAELVESSMVIGDNAYDVVPGFVGEPMAAAPGASVPGARPSRVPGARPGAETKGAGKSRKGRGDAPAPGGASDEDVLARCLTNEGREP
jgi:hypothetical protein